jgi:hypothetical protein
MTILMMMGRKREEGDETGAPESAGAGENGAREWREGRESGCSCVNARVPGLLCSHG